MIPSLRVPKRSESTLMIHALVYDSFVRNVKRNSSAKSVDQFLSAAFTPAARSFYDTFDVGFDIEYVDMSVMNGFASDPPVDGKDKSRMRQMYARLNPEEKITFDMIMYDLDLKKRDRPHVVVAIVGEKEIMPSDIDLFTAHLFIGDGHYPRTSSEKYCRVRTNTPAMMGSMLLHEVGHTLGAEHVDGTDCVMYRAMTHGEPTYAWCRTSRASVRKGLESLELK